MAVFLLDQPSSKTPAVLAAETPVAGEVVTVVGWGQNASQALPSNAVFTSIQVKAGSECETVMTGKQPPDESFAPGVSVCTESCERAANAQNHACLHIR